MEKTGEMQLTNQFQKDLASFSSRNGPTQEPVLAQTDNGTIRRLEELCFEYKPLIHTETKEYVFNERGDIVYERVLIYRDIYALLSSIGHLEGTSGLTWETARGLFGLWEGRQFNPLYDKRYKRDREARNILRQIYGIKGRQFLGDSYRGFRAEHVENVSGARRTFEMREKNMNDGRFPV